MLLMLLFCLPGVIISFESKRLSLDGFLQINKLFSAVFQQIKKIRFLQCQMEGKKIKEKRKRKKEKRIEKKVLIHVP